MKYWTACLFVLAFAIIEVVESGKLCNGCRVRYNVVGCKKDNRVDRALPEQLINERDRTSLVYNGYNVDWYNWDEYLPAFTCRCAEAAMRKGYKYFGLQFWGECWSGPSPDVDTTFDKHGSDDQCYGLGYEKCTGESVNCVGVTNRNFVYKIQHYNCPVKFERLGCYKDNDNPRSLPKYIMNDRDPSNPSYSGMSIDWSGFDTYLPDFACRCAQKAVGKGYNTFGVQYYGECWSGPEGEDDYFKNGVSTSCVNGCYNPCKNFDKFCTGPGYTNFVYRVTYENCEIEYTQLGCYKEKKMERVLGELIIDDVNPQSSQFMGMISTAFNDWSKYMDGLLCRCARKIKEKGFTTFAISNGGECWSGANAADNYADHGQSNDCFYDETSPCSPDKPCAGGESSNYVYKLE